ncbi:MAG: DoxX family protein [Bacteroidota bacterium]|jgi:putative oxidoreductase|nr:DoxX family protein [Bacteroidota bacterium]
MNRFMSTKYSAVAFNLGMLVLRIMLGLLLVSHGYDKMVHFAALKNKFYNFMSLGPTISLSLIIFAEFFCGIFLILGLFTRLVTIPIFIAMSVVVFMVSHGHIFAEGERGAIFLAATFAIILCGPGKISVDGMLGK